MTTLRSVKGSPLTHDELDANFKEAAATVYAEDFGASANGTGDQSTAINNAITAASNFTVAGQRYGGRVQLLNGRYAIGNPILLKSLADLVGISPTATTIWVSPGASCRAIQTATTDEILYGARRLGIYGNAAGQAAQDGTPATDNGGIYLLNAKAEPTAIGDFRFLGGPRSWLHDVLVQEVAGHGIMVQGNAGGFYRELQVRWAERYGFYIDTNDGSFDQLIASRTGWSGLFFDGANSRVANVKTWFCGVGLDQWALARDWAQTNDVQTFNRQFDTNLKAGCGYLIRGDNSRFMMLDTQDTSGIGLYLHSRRNVIDPINCDQIAQVNAGGTTTRYDGGIPGSDWIDLNPGGVDSAGGIPGVYINQNAGGYVRASTYDIRYNEDGTPGGGVQHNVLSHLAYNPGEADMELAVTGHHQIVTASGSSGNNIPVESVSPFRLMGVENAANLP